jgi:aspartate aminotransferase
MSNLSQRVLNVAPSATLAISEQANKLKQQGQDVISLSVGEPDFNTPIHIKQSGIKAITNNKTRYTAVDGIMELKEAIVKKFIKENNLSYTKEQILVSSGGKQSFYNLCQAVIEDKKEVIIPAPYWVSYPPMVTLAGGVPKIIPTTMQTNYKITAQQLEKAITKNTRLFVINSPSNPTGFIYNEQELMELSQVLLQHPDILIATDDMYEHIQWTKKKFINILNVEPKLYERTIVLNGVSKAYAMTGWRIGYCAGNKTIIKAMKKVQSQSTSNPCSISQYAATAALSGDQSSLKTNNKEFKKRAILINKLLNEITGIKSKMADGTFYALADVSDLIKILELKDDIELASVILDGAKVAVVPGSAFGIKNHLRFSFATDEPTIIKAMERIKTLRPL